MDHDQQLFGGLHDDTTSVGSVESVPGGFIPLVWRGTEMPMQSTISVQDVEALAREAEHALQNTTTKIVEDIACLTQETRETFGRVEEAFGDMDSKVESMGISL